MESGRRTSFLLALIVLLAGCSGGISTDTATQTTELSQPSPTITVSASPTDSTTQASSSQETRTTAATSSPSPAATPTRSATPTETPTPTPTQTQTATPERSEQTEFIVTVQRVIDGDTIEVAFANGDVADVRLLGVDTPEVHTKTDPAEFEGIPDSDSGHDHLRTWGKRASSFASERLEIGEEIRIVVDPEADRRGSYGRLLVYVYDDGGLFNLLLLKQGYARLYDSTFSKQDRFASTESTAQRDEVGLWNYTARTPTQTATASEGGGLEVTEIHEDAEGNDHKNENDEYIIFENTGDTTLDLSGWTVSDEADHKYTIPDGFTLDPGDQVKLHTGSGTDTETDLYWGSDSAIWNNGGDTISVKDENGEIILEREYD